MRKICKYRFATIYIGLILFTESCLYLIVQGTVIIISLIRVYQNMFLTAFQYLQMLVQMQLQKQLHEQKLQYHYKKIVQRQVFSNKMNVQKKLSNNQRKLRVTKKSSQVKYKQVKQKLIKKLILQNTIFLSSAIKKTPTLSPFPTKQTYKINSVKIEKIMCYEEILTQLIQKTRLKTPTKVYTVLKRLLTTWIVINTHQHKKTQNFWGFKILKIPKNTVLEIQTQNDNEHVKSIKCKIKIQK
eukprot:TRINITY_DN35919_c0_g2_i1.p1 TRINITY_DN35919_c0_g2~~TRINITY_DN35919_c0_g2_i1.p1  ORF type:complete len:274 (+),score=-17.33 TRINITY_DN35919_c0_g2_i1:98-823(+)